MAKLLSMNHHRAPRMNLCTIHGTVHSAADCRHFANSSGCFFLIFIILRQFYVLLYNYVNWHKVSCEILVVMQVHRRIKFQLPLYVRCLKLLNVEGKAWAWKYRLSSWSIHFGSIFAKTKFCELISTVCCEFLCKLHPNDAIPFH
jgi:hypothetical protein